jgi:hypothetical protein
MYIIHEELYTFLLLFIPSDETKKNPDLPRQIRVDEK